MSLMMQLKHLKMLKSNFMGMVPKSMKSIIKMMMSKIGIQKKESNSDKIKYQMESKILLIMFSSSNKN